MALADGRNFLRLYIEEIVFGIIIPKMPVYKLILKPWQVEIFMEILTDSLNNENLFNEFRCRSPIFIRLLYWKLKYPSSLMQALRQYQGIKMDLIQCAQKIEYALSDQLTDQLQEQYNAGLDAVRQFWAYERILDTLYWTQCRYNIMHISYKDLLKNWCRSNFKTLQRFSHHRESYLGLKEINEVLKTTSSEILDRYNFYPGHVRYI